MNDKNDRKVHVNLAKNISAYATASVSIPAGADVEKWLLENAGSIADNTVFEPYWEWDEQLRVLSATEGDALLVEDLEIEPSIPHIIVWAVQKHWDGIKEKIDPAIAAEIQGLLGRM